jgi:hypothetical protein
MNFDKGLTNKMKNGNTVILDKSKLMEFIGKKRTVKDFTLPKKWNKYFGFDPDKKRKIKVKGASLNDHLQCQKLSEQPGLIFGYILKCSNESKQINPDEILQIVNDDSIGENTIFEIGIFQRNVKDPKFNYEETLSISEKCPQLVNEIAMFSLGITSIK